MKKIILLSLYSLALRLPLEAAERSVSRPITLTIAAPAAAGAPMLAAAPLGTPPPPQLHGAAAPAAASPLPPSALAAAASPAFPPAPAQAAGSEDEVRPLSLEAAPESRPAGRMRGLARSMARALWPRAEAADLPVAAAPAAGGAAALDKPLSEPITVKDKNGIEHPLSYDPRAPRPGLLRRAVRSLREAPEKMRRIAAYKRRVDELVAGVTDEELSWSLSRLQALKSQEGILRPSNGDLVNRWKAGAGLQKSISDRDFASSSLDWGSIAFLFKQSMDREEPTVEYQFTSAHNLHNHMPRVAHFMGTTLQERILQVALRGKPAQQAIWSAEEQRHGPILERVYNVSRDPGRPPLQQQGIASKQPRTGEYSARSMMANRALAEMGAGMAYLTLKANTVKDSPTDLMLHGIYLDEIYHYVIMSAVNKSGYGRGSRWGRILMMLRHSIDYPSPQANDSVIHERRAPPPLLLAEVAYAFNAIDKRVDRYLKGLSAEQLADYVGPFYRTDQDVEAAIARGEQVWTEAARTEQNPDLTKADVEELIARFPGAYSLERRSVTASQIRAILGEYRSRSLANPGYWTRKKGFSPKPSAPGVLARILEKSPGASIELAFAGDRAPLVTVRSPGRPEALHSIALDELSMPQIGALFDADSVDVVEKLQPGQAEPSFESLLKGLNKSSRYQEAPLSLIDD